MTEWTINVIDDIETGDYMIPLPESFLKMHKWLYGDKLLFTLHNDKSITVVNKSLADRHLV